MCDRGDRDPADQDDRRDQQDMREAGGDARIERRDRQRDEQRDDQERELGELPGAGKNAGEIGMPGVDDAAHSRASDAVDQQRDRAPPRASMMAPTTLSGAQARKSRRPRQGALDRLDHALSAFSPLDRCHAPLRRVFRPRWTSRGHNGINPRHC